MTRDINTENQTYNTALAVEAQNNFCEEHNLPNFAPGLDGKCYRCNCDIYRPFTHPDGSVTGITVEQAKSKLITGCPHCNYSFVE